MANTSTPNTKSSEKKTDHPTQQSTSKQGKVAENQATGMQSDNSRDVNPAAEAKQNAKANAHDAKANVEAKANSSESDVETNSPEAKANSSESDVETNSPEAKAGSKTNDKKIAPPEPTTKSDQESKLKGEANPTEDAKPKSTEEAKSKPTEESEAKSAVESKVKSGDGANVKSGDEANQKPAEKEEAVGKGPKPVGASQQTWDNPEASEEVRKKIEDQKSRLEQLHDNPNNQDPQLEALNKKQDIESRNEDPDHDKKSENSTQENFDPGKNKVDAPAH